MGPGSVRGLFLDDRHIMLDTIRNLAKTWVAKLLLLILAVGFGSWGISSYSRQTGDNAIAHVGKTRITVEDFQRVFDRQIEAMKRQFGDSFDRRQARLFGLDQQVLS